MAVELPAPRRGRLRYAPLALVVCQVRFELQAASFAPSHMFAIHEALGGARGLYPKVEEMRAGGFTVQVGPNGLMSGDTPVLSGYRLQSDTSDWFVSLMPDHVGLETTRYTTWDDDFKERIRSILEAANAVVGPQTEQRVGLRYVDRITRPMVTHPAQLREYLIPELLGIALHETIGPGVRSSQQQVDIECSSDARCTLRHGYAADPTRNNALTYVLDWDIYREGIRPFDVPAIRDCLDGFDDLALRLFQATITPVMTDLLDGEGQ